MNETYEYEGLYAKCITEDLVEIKTKLDDKNPIATRKPSSISLEDFMKRYVEFLKKGKKPKLDLKGIL